MSVTDWIRSWSGSGGGRSGPNTPVLAAARGEPIGRLLHLSASALLSAVAADRAGIWLCGDRHGPSETGCVVEAEPGPIPEQWKRLDVAAPFLREALERLGPLRVEFVVENTTARLGPLMGMHSVVWIPLREQERTFGLAMVAHAHPPGKLDLERLRAQADEIVLAVQHRRNARRAELNAESLRAQSRISRAILCGVSAGYVLRQICAAARRYAGAEFIALGRGSEPPFAEDGWEGAGEWLPMVHGEKLSELWRKTFEEGRGSEIPAEQLADNSGARPPAARAELERIVAIPVEGRRETRGVMMAGILHSGDCDDDYSRLESYALLAAAALDRESARTALAASEETLRRVVRENRECLVIVDAQGKILEASRAGAKLLFPGSGRKGGTVLEELFSREARAAVAEWREGLASMPSTVSEQTIPPVLEAALERGGIVRMRLRSEVGGTLGAGQAWLIHLEDQGAPREKRESEERLQAEMAGLLDSIESGVLLLDEEGRILLASDRLAAILGVESRRLVEFGTMDALIESLAGHFLRPAETASRWRELIRRGDEASWDEMELVHPSRKIVERFSRPLYKPDGTRLGWLEVYRDITGQRLIQSKLLQTEKMAALGQLVSGIAHELNNPLTSIQGYAQLLLGRRSASDRTGDAVRISQEAERAGRIVKNLLLFSREAKSERHDVNLNDVIERTLSLRSYELKLENIEVELALDPGLPQTLADSAQLQQVVLNLIVNAEQAIVMSRGEDFREGHILIRTRRLPGDRVSIEVSDDGPGIPPEIASRIFDPFFTTKPAGVGTGLGLSIVYGIVQEHGGEVSVDSLPGRGATFCVELPALSIAGFDFTGEEKVAERKLPAVISLPQARGAREEILVVEDEPTVAALIADVLTDEGHRVDTLVDSREALGRLEEKKYSLVICDLKMPYLDGPGLYRALVRRDNPTQHRLLFVTGDTMGPRTIEFLKSSALPYLAKPFLIEELKEAVRRALAVIQAGEALAAPPGRSHVASTET